MDYQVKAIVKSVEVVFQTAQKWMPLILFLTFFWNKTSPDILTTLTVSTRQQKEAERKGATKIIGRRLQKHTFKLSLEVWE